ncbi:hypothetical protein MTR67_030339 [Solanum verrucosum]|uniref:PTM/DIR17-like Tudor domain-containing protein n=1 Tax=Solanum verrucosum TaxID=315347 RepID=A0AAF0TYC4_SOLVR|nr:hypothetical protein MTR67_030339 [Solanum verrucosum]
MDFSSKENDVEESLPTGVFEISGELNVGFGQWFEGREVHKLFGGKYYNGKVTKFDEKTDWFRVKYEDVDNEDLEWHELEEVLQPLDTNIPLKDVVTKIIKSK